MYVLIFMSKDPMFAMPTIELTPLQVAAKGNLQEFQRLYEADDSRLNIQDSRGSTPAHKGAENGQVNILDFIVNHGGGNILFLFVVAHLSQWFISELIV